MSKHTRPFGYAILLSQSGLQLRKGGELHRDFKDCIQRNVAEYTEAKHEFLCFAWIPQTAAISSSKNGVAREYKAHLPNP
jgi:hypothetical protein